MIEFIMESDFLIDGQDSLKQQHACIEKLANINDLKDVEKLK